MDSLNYFVDVFRMFISGNYGTWKHGAWNGGKILKIFVIILFYLKACLFSNFLFMLPVDLFFQPKHHVGVKVNTWI